MKRRAYWYNDRRSERIALVLMLASPPLAGVLVITLYSVIRSFVR